MKRFAFAAALAATTIGLSAFADLPDMPPIKEGLWKIHTVDTYPGQPTQDTTIFLCRDHAYDNSVREKMKTMKAKCVTSSDTTVGNKRMFTSTCDTGSYRTESKSVLTGSDNAYHTETDSTITVSGKTSTSKTVQDQTYMGPCPAGMSPGDRKLADGTIQKHR
jgi:5-hydroxyisourate hydrolase-like protein (transthyretin family)